MVTSYLQVTRINNIIRVTVYFGGMIMKAPCPVNRVNQYRNPMTTGKGTPLLSAWSLYQCPLHPNKNALDKPVKSQV